MIANWVRETAGAVRGAPALTELTRWPGDRRPGTGDCYLAPGPATSSTGLIAVLALAWSQNRFGYNHARAKTAILLVSG
jgi:hypothetical protein